MTLTLEAVKHAVGRLLVLGVWACLFGSLEPAPSVFRVLGYVALAIVAAAGTLHFLDRIPRA